MRKVSLTIVIIFLALNVSGQTLQEYQVMITTMNASPDPVVRQEAIHLDSLLYQMQPKIHLKNFVQTVTGETDPVCLITDNESTGMLSSSNPLYGMVELVTVRILGPEDLGFILNLANLPAFGHLKYVQFLCLYPADPETLTPLFTPNNPGLTVFYRVSLPN